MSNGSGARCRCCDYVNVFVSVFGGGLTRFHRCDVRTAVRDSVTPLPSQPRASPVLFAFVAYTVPMSPSLLLVGSCSRGLPRDVYPPIVTVGSLPRRELGSADPAPRPSASVPRPTSPTRLSPRRSPRRSGGDDTSDLQNQSPYRAAPAHTGHGYAQPTLQEQQQQQQDPASGYLKPTAAFISRAQRNGVLFNGDGVYGVDLTSADAANVSAFVEPAPSPRRGGSGGGSGGYAAAATSAIRAETYPVSVTNVSKHPRPVTALSPRASTTAFGGWMERRGASSYLAKQQQLGGQRPKEPGTV